MMPFEMSGSRCEIWSLCYQIKLADTLRRSR